MAVEQKLIYVYDDFSFDESVMMGILYVNVIRGGESYSFEYDSEWLNIMGPMSSIMDTRNWTRP